MTKPNKKPIRILLGVLLAFLALNAFGGGYYGMSGAKGIPLEWLNGSPFRNYFIPSLFLFLCVGGISLTASVLVFLNHRRFRLLTYLCCVIVLFWLAVQVVIIGFVSWMQPATAVLILLILLLNRFIGRHEY